MRRILTLRLATVRDDGEPTRRRAGRGEFTDEEWRLVSELADYPNRLLVTAASDTGHAHRPSRNWPAGIWPRRRAIIDPMTVSRNDR